MYAKIFKEMVENGEIIVSNSTYKIKLFLEKAENSLLIAKNNFDNAKNIYWYQWVIIISYYSMLYAAKAAILTQSYETKSHESTQIAFGYLFIPNQIDKADLELLNQAYKILENEYIKYFEDALSQSWTARYTVVKSYTQRSSGEVLENARRFIEKIEQIM